MNNAATWAIFPKFSENQGSFTIIIVDKTDTVYPKSPIMPSDFALPELCQQWANTVLIWIGFGTLVGLLAKAIMPGRDPGGAVVTLAMGIGGSVIGCGTLAYFYQGAHVTPISVLGFIVATGGAFILLFFYRLLAGYWFTEGDFPRRRYTVRRPARARRYQATEYIDGR
jgi:uncharacterized membrane protein YeaQ/YmgE (transglycosylase-associated protein family)